MNYSFVNYWKDIQFPDGVYNGRYNKEPALIRIENGIPQFVQFMENSSIYKASGILLSSVEILLPAQKI